MTRILGQAAQIASAQMRVQSLADCRADRVVWDGRQWEWAVLRPENGTFDADTKSIWKRARMVLPGPDRVPGDVRPGPPEPARCTGFPPVTARAPISTVAGPTSSAFRCRCPTSCLVDHRLRRPDPHRNRHRPAPGRAAVPGRTHPRSPRRRRARRAALQSRAAPRHTGQVGSRPSPAGAGLSTFASTAPTPQPSTAPVRYPTSSSRADPGHCRFGRQPRSRWRDAPGVNLAVLFGRGRDLLCNPPRVFRAHRPLPSLAREEAATLLFLARPPGDAWVVDHELVFVELDLGGEAPGAEADPPVA
jgi:hypothetical protein